MSENMETIEVGLTDEEFLYLAKRAHEQDITLNQLVNNILLQHLEDLKLELKDASAE
jgi:hypothetical protein